MRFKLIRQPLEVFQKLLGHVTGVLQMNVKVPIKLLGVRRCDIEREVPLIDVVLPTESCPFLGA
jgi:hypothetical protein